MLKLKFSLICLPILALFLCSCEKKEEALVLRKDRWIDHSLDFFQQYISPSNLINLVGASNRLEALRWIESIENPICTSAILSRDQDKYTLNCECITPKEISDENGIELTFTYKDLSIAVPLQEQSEIFLQGQKSILCDFKQVWNSSENQELAQIFDDPSGLPKIQLFSGSSFKAEYSVTLLDKNSEENQKLEKQIEERIKQKEEEQKQRKEQIRKSFKGTKILQLLDDFEKQVQIYQTNSAKQAEINNQHENHN